jgi:prepilin signal peptidase PulO-like enzyme (type II secretory pathway)
MSAAPDFFALPYLEWPYLEWFVVVFVGLVLGSFTTAVAFRVPRGIPWAFGPSKDRSGQEMSAYRSACPACQKKLGFFDLIPVFSWLLLQGRCRSCKAPIPIRYPLIELGVVLSLIIAYLVFGFSASLLFAALAIPFLWALFVIDFEYLILPNQLVAILAGIGLLRLFYRWGIEGRMTDIQVLEYLSAAVVFAFFIWFLGFIMSKALKKDSLGFGDVKFFAVAGLWHGLASLAAFSLISGVSGIVFALIWRWKTKEEVFPFGPALIFSFYVLLLLDGSHFF